MNRQQFVSRVSAAIRLSQVHRIFMWVADRVRYAFVDKRKVPTIGHEGERTADRLAILAIFQMRGLSRFVKAEVEFLRSIGYDVAISIPHKLPEADLMFLRERCRFIVFRDNFGRDFGSYRDGILAVGFDRISEYERVLLINDSIFFPLGETDRFVKEFFVATEHSELVGLSENSESIRHVASFFVDCSTRLFCSAAVRNYWENYKVYNSRFHAIRAGECGLSKVLYKEARSIHILYSKERIIHDMYERFNEGVDIKQFMQTLPDPFFNGLKERLLASASSRRTEGVGLAVVDAFRGVLEASSVPHSFGLSLMTIYGVPLLKRDVYFHDVFDLAQVRIVLSKIVDDETLQSILLELRKKGAPRNQTVWAELMIRIGMR